METKREKIVEPDHEACEKGREAPVPLITTRPLGLHGAGAKASARASTQTEPAPPQGGRDVQGRVQADLAEARGNRVQAG